MRLEGEERRQYAELVKMRAKKVQRKIDATVEFEVLDVVDLSIDIL